MNPEFPVIWFGDKNCVAYHNDEQELSTTELMFWGPLTFEYGTIIDITGQHWKLSLEDKETITLGKLIKILFGCQLRAKVLYEYLPQESYSLDEVKKKLIAYSENDPGDIMWQFIEHEDIVKGVNGAESFKELFSFVECEICSEGNA